MATPTVGKIRKDEQYVLHFILISFAVTFYIFNLDKRERIEDRVD